MAGVKHDALADIGLITDNLRDRYKTGFPILKEIVQNADDAGATHLSIGYSKGLPLAKHELLNNPAVFFINDGPLTAENADGILSIALGSKASDEKAIGKFGLGMKSLFHLCEAFFYLSDQWAEGEDYHSNIFNPWSDLRATWEEFDKADKHLIQQHLEPVLQTINEKTKSKTWFLVWVPLRKRHSQFDGSIIEYYPGDNNNTPDFLHDKNIEIQLAQLLPLLKGLNTLSIWQPLQDGKHSFQCTSNVKLHDGAVRRQFHAPIVKTDLAGKIFLESDSRQQPIEFAGYENLLPDEMFQRIRSSEFWPKSYERDRKTGKENKVEDKAKPHLAIVICQQKASERSSCHIDWAVFLPLGSYTQTDTINVTNLDDKYHTQVFIHGYFFVDAGRKHIYALDSIGKPIDSIESNDDVRSQWNSILATEGCLSHLPEAVKNFVVAHNCGVDRIQHLSEAIFKSSFARKNQEWISKRYQWMFQLQRKEKAWQLISADTHPLPLPRYPEREFDRPWTVFPKLDEMDANGYVFYDQSQVSSLNNKHGGWSEELILGVLKIDVTKIFSDRPQFTYLNDFLSLDEIRQTQAVKESLQSLARRGLKGNIDKLAKSEMTRFLEFIPPGQRVILNKVKLNGLWARLATVETRMLILPKELAPETDKTVSLLLDDAHLLLQSLDAVLGDASSVKDHDEAQALVAEVIGLIEQADKGRLLSICTDLRLFNVHDLANGKDKFFTKRDLLRFIEQKSLFRFSSGLGNDKFGLGNELHKAIDNSFLYFIGTNDRILAFDKQISLPECDAKACLNYIDNKRPALNNAKKKGILINRLASVADLTANEKRAFRYLLHGDINHYSSDAIRLLSVDTGLDPVWGKMAKAIYKAGSDDWRIIDQELIDDLSNKLSNQLDVNKLTLENLVEALSNRLEDIHFSHFYFDRKEFETVLTAIESEELWKRLPFHETISGQRAAISDQCFLDNEFDVPVELENKFIRIKKSSNPKIAAQQKWIKPLDKFALIRIILSADCPHKYYQLLLDQIYETPLDEEVFLLLKSSKWLMLENGKIVKPDDIIYIEGLIDEVKRLTSDCDSGYYAPDDIALSIRQHIAYTDLRKLFACDKEGLESLLLMLGDNENYYIGELSFKVEELLQYADFVADNLNLPGWEILANKKIKYLLSQSENGLSNSLKPILGPLTSERYQAILNALKQCHEQAISIVRPKIITLFNAYLSLFSSCVDVTDRLKEMKLLNKQGTWVQAKQLCIDIEGVDGHYLLNREQAICLDSVIYFDKQSRIEKHNEFVTDEKLLLQSTPDTLRTYFKDWDGRVESELIGFFLCLLGTSSEIERVASSFLGKRSLAGARNKINWQINRGVNRDKVLFDGLTQHEAIEKMVFLIRIEDQSSIVVNSIFNEPITVKLHDRPNTIIVNHSFAGQYKILFQLRRLNFSDWSDISLSTLLKNSAEFILRKVYEQSTTLEQVWTELGESDQLDIEVARGLILDELPANLRQLSLQQNDLHEYLHSYHNAKSQKKELEITYGSTEAIDKEIKNILQKMQEALINDTDSQIAVLQAIKNKISNHQYQLYSVPFELFQNADDAVFEFAEMEAYPEISNLLNENISNDHQRHFYILQEDEALSFVHWGRAVNYFRGSEGFPGKERGFHRDLEKMLLLNTSDKQAENQVTGKFGLGFKSVYLISDRPKILSGRLGVEIFAAMLPEALKEGDRSRLKNKIDDISQTQLTATLIELPISQGIFQEEVLVKFKCYAGVLAAFSKMLKRIYINKQTAAVWQEERIIDTLPEIRKGTIHFPDEKMDAIKFSFSEDKQTYDLLFLIGALGFKNFPQKVEQEKIPQIWILAPTHDESSIGFLINAGFEVDMGRMQLAYESDKNQQIALQLGMRLASILERLESLISKDWSQVRQAFDLASDMTPYRFWQSLWSVLVSSWIRKDDNKVHQLVRGMLTKPNASFITLVSERALLPNGLWDDYQHLIQLSSVKFILKGVLGQDKYFRQAQVQLTPFINAEELIHEKIHEEVYQLLPDDQKQLSRWPTFDLATFAEKSFPDRKAGVEQSSFWGELLSQDILDELDKSEERKKEKLQLDKALSSLEFNNRLQKYTPVSDLLDSQYGSPEERLRAAFAPDLYILHTQYDEHAASFFRISRKQYKALLEQMEDWALQASDLHKQIGVLLYLLWGERSDALAEKLRTQSKGTWLADLHEQSEHFNDWSKADITKVLKRKLATDEAMDRLKVGEETIVAQPKPLDPKIVLNNVYNWWQTNKVDLLTKYNRHVYPDGVFPGLVSDSGVIVRDGWMTLLFLGSLHTAGRTQDVQHRDAIHLFKSKKWWDVFVQNNPQNVPEQWMQVLDEYLQDQFYGSQYESWMMRFVTIYRFACWLEDYAQSWMAIQQQSTNFSLEQVLNTATSHVHIGGGVSAPRLSRTLGIGANFMLRELVRNKVLTSASAIVSSEHCFVPHLRVRKLFNRLGMQLDEEYADINQSQQIYNFVAEKLGKEKATFDGSFDIPFQFISRDSELEKHLFSNELVESGIVHYVPFDDAPLWAWDLLSYVSFFIDLVRNNDLPEPVVGYELIGDDRRVLMQLELAWDQYQVGVLTDDEYDYYQLIQIEKKLGWKIFPIDDLEDDLERFLMCFGKETIGC